MAGKKSTGGKTTGKKTGKHSPLLAAAAVAIACAAIAFTQFGGEKARQTSGAETGGVQTIAEGESLVIPVSEVTETASFYPIEVDGMQMEVLAVKDSAGTIRTAFNTCQICYSSGRGYYVQSGDVLVCQNCGNRFTVDQVEIESGGCNPWPIFPENKTVTGDTISISYDFLNASKEIFARWKAGG